ncbi:MAG: hypothetical protein WD823_00165 [Sulfuricaulis sp.]|uniref:hypothetical protein n=1 Tax=Sulfuricaulis sp. TaxID=2003553 RepID=UPI0034A3959C
MRFKSVRLAFWIAAIVPMVLGVAPAFVNAASLKIESVVSPKEEIRFEFADGSKHFVAMMRREGKATGQGVLSGATVTEYGMHDIQPGISGDPHGYLVFTLPEGDIAYVKWVVRGVFVRGADGKPMLLDNGVWEVVGSTGKLKGLQGAGTLHIKRVPSPLERRFILEGELFTATDGPKK